MPSGYSFPEQPPGDRRDYHPRHDNQMHGDALGPRPQVTHGPTLAAHDGVEPYHKRDSSRQNQPGSMKGEVFVMGEGGFVAVGAQDARPLTTRNPART